MKQLFLLFPFLEWIHELKNKTTIKKDIIAGMSVAFILVPQSMAYASLAGLPIQVGLYTAFIAPIIAGLFGSSRQMSTGPVTIISLMSVTAIAQMNNVSEQEYILYASLLAIFIGLFYLLLSFLRLGVIVNFLSHPVIIGFTNGVAIITILSQIGKIFGISSFEVNILSQLSFLIQEISISTHITTLCFGIGSIILLLGIEKTLPKIPKILVVIIASISISYLIGYHEIYSGSIVGYVPNHFPEFHSTFFQVDTYQKLGFDQILHLWFYAVIIGVIGFTESISVAKFAGYKSKQQISANKELYGQGLANIGSGLFGGYGVAGSFSKTAVALRNGATTGFTSVVTGIIVGITLIFFTPFLYHLPLATLAAIIIVAVAHLIKIAPLTKAWKIEPHDAIIGFTTFGLTIVLAPNIETAILIGVCLSIGLYIYRSMIPRVREVAFYKDGELRDIKLFAIKPNKHVSIIRFDGYLYFANSNLFEEKVFDIISSKRKLKYLIFDLEWMNNIDASGEEMIENLFFRIQQSGIQIFISGIRPKVMEKFVSIKLFSKIIDIKKFSKVTDALAHIKGKHKHKKQLKNIDFYQPEEKYEPDLNKKTLKEFRK